MARIVIGINLEFVRSAGRPFAWGVAKAAELGYRYVEPMVHWGRELLSEAGYFHSFSMLDDPLVMREVCARHGVKLSGLSALSAGPARGQRRLPEGVRRSRVRGPACAEVGRTMTNRLLLSLLTPVLVILVLTGTTSPASGQPAPGQRLPFVLPPGFVAERVAGPPLVNP